MTRPLTPEMLADRWLCSAETVRQLVKRGDLRGFRLGRMFRITMEAVEEYEACQNIGSVGSTDGLSSPGTMQTESAGAIVLTHAPERKPRVPR